MSKFERPQNLEYPKIHNKFKAFDADSSVKATFVIKDLTADLYDDVVKFMFEYFVPDEPAFKSRDIKLDKLAIIEISRIWREQLGQNVSIVCFKEGNDEIVAVNILGVKSISNDDDEGYEDEDKKITSQDLHDIISLHNLLEKQFNPYKTFDTASYLSDFGLAVHPDYRRRGIGTEMLKIRAKLLNDLELKVAVSHFVGTASQHMAAKVKYSESYVLSYDELYRINTNFYFSGVDGLNVKVMSLEGSK
ncbi:uncharacterized protein [Chironomus tepperi]|uniref:uncharacterized protein n=1 Tax=Chironomus tepperi TaxID=113505 RepID=UPI00391EE38A